MPTIKAYIVKRFTSELAVLRRKYFPGPKADNADVFDQRSEYMILENNEEIIATGRITPNPDGPLIMETKGMAAFRNLPDTVDMGKYLIVREFQGIDGLYEMLCLTIYEYALKSGFLFANAGIVAGHRLLRRVEPMGFKAIGGNVPIQLSNGNTPNIVPLMCNLRQNEQRMLQQLDHWSTSLASRGWMVERAY